MLHLGLDQGEDAEHGTPCSFIVRHMHYMDTCTFRTTRMSLVIVIMRVHMSLISSNKFCVIFI